MKNTACWLGLALSLLAPPPAAAQTSPATPVPARPKGGSVDLTLLSLADLMNVEITSASHKEQRLREIAAAVHVITQEDIHRSGLTTVPELLRLVPGVHVAQINSNKWAVAIRGFNNLFSDKVLVLIDGRTMYDRLNSAVFWESLDVPLELIERIEVVRGPGGATWGANAMNGVINIITKSAADTQGTGISASTGTFDGVRGAARYGGKTGNLFWRVNSHWSDRGESRDVGNTTAGDSWRSQTHGFRLDWNGGSGSTVTAQGGATLATLNGLWHETAGPVPAQKPEFRAFTDTREYFALAKWTRRTNERASFEVQSFVNYRHNIDSVNPRQLIADVEARYRNTYWDRHDLIVGTGYRFLDEKTGGGFGEGFAYSITPRNVNEAVVNAFVQDDIALGPRVHVSLGAKVERDTYAGWGVQPTARALWSIVPERQQLWAAVSRALHTPSLGDVSGRYNYTSFVGQGGLPIVIGAIGNPHQESEEVVNTEAGYRAEIGSVGSISVTGFIANYDKLKTSEPLAPRMEFTPAPAHLFSPKQFGNLLAAKATGVEIAARWTPVEWWRLEAAYSRFDLSPRLSPQSGDTAAAAFDGNVPGSQWQVRSALSITPRVQLDTMLYRVGALRNLKIDGYTRADVRAEVALGPRLSAALVARNLFDPRHTEFAGAGAIVTPTEIPRSAQLQLFWRF